jgi:photosystem II stability/assembly factor-like uncharacterized protein
MGEGVRLYAGTQDGLFTWRSSNGGWHEVNRSFPEHIIDSIAGSRHRPERVFAAVMHDGLYRTEDGGQRWSKVLEGDLRAVALDPSDDTVYAGTEPVHLYRSEDGGERWEELTGLLDLPEEVRQRWWFPRPPHQGHVRDIFIHPDDPNTIYLCLEHGGIVRSLDRGRTWEDVSAGIDYVDMHLISSLPGSRERYYTASARGFFRSDDPARGWQRAEHGFTRDYFHHFIFLPPAREGAQPTMLAATADKSPGPWNREARGARAALFRSEDGADSWQRVTEGLADDLDPMIWGLTHHPHDPHGAFAGLGDFTHGPASRAGASGAGALLLSRDRGASWQPLDIAVPAVSGLWVAAD